MPAIATCLTHQWRIYDYDAFGKLIRERRGTPQKLVTEYRYDCQHRLIGDHPRTNFPDSDRLVSADGKRSIRYGAHEMGGKE